MLHITEISVHGYERVVHGIDTEIGLDAIIAIHNTNLGTALGGCRMMEYSSSDEHLADVLALSKGMTYKNAMAGLALGGGKSAINLTPTKGVKSEVLIERFCALLNYVNSDGEIYVTSGDIGSGPAELEMMAKYTKFVQGQDGSDSGTATAYGVFNAMLGALDYKKLDVADMTVAISGLGKVGARLARFLKDAGAKLIVADFNAELAEKIAAEVGAEVRDYREIHKVACDVYAPCAIGGAINDNTIDELRCQIVCGGANNQLATTDMGGRLMDRGIVYVPDYVSNAGGVIIVEKRGKQYIDCEYEHPEIKPNLERIRETVLNIMRESDMTEVEPALVADRMAERVWKRHDEWAVMGGAMVG